jgi:hypothetical protein
MTLAGANENGNYFMSAGIYNEKGYVINNDYKRYNFRLNLDYKIRKNISIGARTDGQFSNQTFGLPNFDPDFHLFCMHATKTLAKSPPL